MNKKGFTLAEVLITLGIIGVVAALTLPSVIGNYQKQTYVTGAKKAYSTLTNMMSKIAADDGVGGFAESYFFSGLICTPDWANGGVANGCEDNYGNPSKFEEIIPKYLNVVKICKANECGVEYYSHGYIENGKLRTSSSRNIISQESYTFGPVTGFYTADGMIYYFSIGYNAIMVFMDVNGEKQPNTAGRDLFYVTLCSNGRTIGGNPHGGCDSYHDDFRGWPLFYLMRNGWNMDY